jgi:hypothetical protein
MRAFFITLVLLAAIAAGFYYYWRDHPEVFAREAEAPEAAPPPTEETLPRRAEFCSAQDARYEHAGSRELKLRLVAGPGAVTARGDGIANYDNLGTLIFVVGYQEREFRFAAASSLGPTMNYLFPMTGAASVEVPRGVDLIQMSAFDTQYAYVPGLARLDHAAPAHVFAPNLSRWLYERGGEPRIEAPVGFFDFVACEPAAAAAQAPAAPTPP